MSSSEIIYTEDRRFSPISYWVHHGVGEEETAYSNCTKFDPPFPNKDPIMGYPYLLVQVLGFELEFSSSLELDHCIEVLSQKNMATTNQLSNIRGTGAGPNTHWLSRLPSELKSWVKREKIVAALEKAKTKAGAKCIGF